MNGLDLEVTHQYQDKHTSNTTKIRLDKTSKGHNRNDGTKIRKSKEKEQERKEQKQTLNSRAQDKQKKTRQNKRSKSKKKEDSALQEKHKNGDRETTKGRNANR